MGLPPRLVEEIVSGNCVAFVGAGFTAPVVPPWRTLLAELADTELDDEALRPGVQELIDAGTSRSLGAAAQTLRDALGEERFFGIMQERLASPPVDETMQRRLELLGGIPFRAILTTNFDGVLAGKPPDRQAYLEVLRPRGHRWWDERFWEGSRGARVVKLHGSVEDPRGVVLTHRDYRRLYSNPAYSTFLRSVMASTTVLYMGFSFSDAYLNELRSEILALLDHRGGDVPVAYAIVNDPTEAERRYSLEHEGIRVLPVDTGGGRDFSDFDRYLEEIHGATNPERILSRLIAGRSILWVGPRRPALRLLEAGAGTDGALVRSVSAPEGVHLEDFDLVIWCGERAAGERRTIDLVLEPRSERYQAFESGAVGVAADWGELVQELVRIFG